MERKNKIVYLGMIGDIMHPGLINIINEATYYTKKAYWFRRQHDRIRN